jgi:hypothetical protein
MRSELAIAQRINSSLQWIEAFPFEARWEWLNSSRESWRRAAANWFESWLIGLSSLSRAWITGRMSSDQEQRFQTILHKHGHAVGDLRSRAFKVHPSIFDALLRCGSRK